MKRWYSSSFDLATIPLWLLSTIFRGLVKGRRFCYRKNFKKSYRFPVPVIVVGNITVGGTGKTPFVLWLAQFLQEQGFRPGIVSRGVGGKQQRQPRWVAKNSDPHLVGDEAILLAKSDCPVVIGIDRVAAIHELLNKTTCNIILSDDGLQHYRMARDLEILIIDGMRGLGNKKFLPAGPLRESPKRMHEVDYVIENIFPGEHEAHHSFFVMKLCGDRLSSLKHGENQSLSFFQNCSVHAVAAIGNPQRFFSLLRQQGLQVIEHIFPDHYLFSAKDFNFGDELPIIMTEKDAVKCNNIADNRFWYLPVKSELSHSFVLNFLEKIQEFLPKHTENNNEFVPKYEEIL